MLALCSDVQLKIRKQRTMDQKEIKGAAADNK